MYIFSPDTLCDYSCFSSSKQAQVLERPKRPANLPEGNKLSREISGVCFQMVCINQDDTLDMVDE